MLTILKLHFSNPAAITEWDLIAEVTKAFWINVYVPTGTAG